MEKKLKTTGSRLDENGINYLSDRKYVKIRSKMNIILLKNGSIHTFINRSINAANKRLLH